MEMKILLKSNLKSHYKSIIGIFVLILLVFMSLATVLTVWINSGRYVNSQMERLGYGDITIWVSGVSQVAVLEDEIISLDNVDNVGIQPIIFSEYEVGENKSDSEGQLITYEPEKYSYKFFSNDLDGYISPPDKIDLGEIYLPASMISMFDITVGDVITFPIARSGKDVTFTVAGFFEDPFMGSSMIGMKGFLINEQEHEKIVNIIQNTDRDSLAREGYMLHISQLPDSNFTAAQFNEYLNNNTNLQSYTEFSHSCEAISGFMLTLQNVFTSILISFVIIMFLASFAVISYSIGSTIEQDYKNMGILKTMGLTSYKLRLIQLLQYMIILLLGIVSGTLISIPLSRIICNMTVTTTGLIIPSKLPIYIYFGIILVIFLLLMCFVWFRTVKISCISPISVIQNIWKDNHINKTAYLSIKKKWLFFWIALRQILSEKRRYIGCCVVTVLLVFFASVIGRINSWLGPNGEGLMDAFNPADLHIAAQPMGETSIDEVEQIIEKYSNITDSYMLAMPNISINDIDITANVITESQWFHILSGSTCKNADEIVITEFVASDLDLSIGDTVVLTGSLGSEKYKVTGIYQCANDMGNNIGMNREGYYLIGEEFSNMWCTHYFISEPEYSKDIMQTLQDTFGGDVYLHENSWPGLEGIISAMNILMIFLYVIVIVFVLVVTLLTSSKLLQSEEKDLKIYQIAGFSSFNLRFSFSIRFGVIAIIGSVLGTALSVLLTDKIVSILMRMEGISNFYSQPNIFIVLFPGFIVFVLFILFAYLASGKIKNMSMTSFMDE